MAIQNINTYEGNPALAEGGALGVVKPEKALDAFDTLISHNFLRNKQLYDAQKDIFGQIQTAAEKDVFDTEKVDPKSLPEIVSAVNEYRTSIDPSSYLMTPKNQEAYLARQQKFDNLQAKINTDKANYALIQKIQQQAVDTPYLAPQVNEHVDKIYGQKWDERTVDPYVPAVNYNYDELVTPTLAKNPIDKTTAKGGFLMNEKGENIDYEKTDYNVQLLLSNGLGVGEKSKIPLGIQSQHLYADYIDKFKENPQYLSTEIKAANDGIIAHNKATGENIPLIEAAAVTEDGQAQPLDPYQFTRAFVYTKGAVQPPQTDIKSQLTQRGGSGEKGVTAEDVSIRKQNISDVQNRVPGALDIFRTYEVNGVPVKDVRYADDKSEDLIKQRDDLYAERDAIKIPYFGGTKEKDRKDAIQEEIDALDEQIKEQANKPTTIEFEAQDGKKFSIEVSDKTGGGFQPINQLYNQLPGQLKISNEDFSKTGHTTKKTEDIKYSKEIETGIEGMMKANNMTREEVIAELKRTKRIQ
jgi:hypothetical protein